MIFLVMKRFKDERVLVYFICIRKLRPNGVYDTAERFILARVEYFQQVV